VYTVEADGYMSGYVEGKVIISDDTNIHEIRKEIKNAHTETERVNPNPGAARVG